MVYKNARIFGADFRFHHGAFEVVDGKFGAILPENVPEDAIGILQKSCKPLGNLLIMITCSRENLTEL